MLMRQKEMGFSPTGCQGGRKDSEEMLMHLAFDEGSGTAVSDSSGNLQDAQVHYLFTHASYMDDREPQWRDTGVEGGSLLFDGCSTYIAYAPEEICVGGDAVSISVWAAPRVFEWDRPDAAENGTEHLTGIVSQYDKRKKQGFVLGYQRFGRLCFQAGTGGEWLTLWGSGQNLEKYEWNQVTAVFNGREGKMCLYLNGKKIGMREIEAGSAICPAEREKLFVGRNSEAEQIDAGTFRMFSGLMGGLRLYQRALSEAEIMPVKAPEIAFTDIWLENILTQDIYKTQYHGGPYQHWMNEPHAPMYYNGMYHLFYQNNMVGPYWGNICWGHLVSRDMVNWKPVKEAITPAENTVVPDGVWSGGAALDVNGIPVLFFTAANDSFALDGLISNQNIGAAYPADLSDPELTDWVVCDRLAVRQAEGHGRAGECRDSHIWKEGDIWCMVVCAGSMETDGGSAILYESGTLEVKDGMVDMDWQYKGPVYELDDPPAAYGTSWELPVLLPVSNKEGTVTRHVFFISPAPVSTADNKIYYFVGDFDVDTGKFTPDERFDNHPALLDYGCNVFTGPSAFIDPQSGDICMFSIMQDQRNGAEEGRAGWAHCVGLTRNIWLNDAGTDLIMKPAKALNSLERDVLAAGKNLTLEQANGALKAVKGDLLYLRAVLVPGDHVREFGIALKADGDKAGVYYAYHMDDGTISGDTENKGSIAPTGHVQGPLALEDGKLRMEVYIDRSLVEAFFNDEKSVSMRVYSEYGSQGVWLAADGEVVVEELYAAKMQGIYA